MNPSIVSQPKDLVKSLVETLVSPNCNCSKLHSITGCWQQIYQAQQALCTLATMSRFGSCWRCHLVANAECMDLLPAWACLYSLGSATSSRTELHVWMWQLNDSVHLVKSALQSQWDTSRWHFFLLCRHVINSLHLGLPQSASQKEDHSQADSACPCQGTVHC